MSAPNAAVSAKKVVPPQKSQKPTLKPCSSAVTKAAPASATPAPRPRPTHSSGAMSPRFESSSATAIAAAAGTTRPLASDCS